MINTFIIAGCASFFILFTTYYFLGLKSLITNLMLLGLYTLLVPCLYFTFVSWIEKEVVENQISDVATSIKNDADNLGATLPSLNITVDKSADKKTKDNNNKLIKEAFIFSSVFAFISVAATYLLTKFSKKDISFRFIAYENFLILVFIIVVELLFFGLVVKNYKTVDTNNVIGLALEELSKKF